MPKTQKPGIGEMTLVIKDGAEFDDIVSSLKEMLTINKPGLRGPKACAPCLSGLDRLVVESDIFRQMR